jgi:outer membrane protein
MIALVRRLTIVAVVGSSPLIGAPPDPASAQAVAPDRAPPGSLAEVVRRVLDAHPSVEAAREATLAARADVAAARAQRRPSVGAEASALRYQEPMVVAPIHGFDPSLAPDFDRTLVQGSLVLDYTLFDGGRRSAQVSRARALEGASNAELAEVRAALIERTTQAYLALLTARDLVASQDALEAALDEERARVQRFLDEGAAPRLELLRAEAEVASARADGEAGRRSLALAAATLGHLLDVDPALVAAWPLAEPVPPTERARPSAPVPDLDASPRVAGALRTAAAATAALDLARTRRLPTVGAIGGYTLFAGGETNATGEWRAGVRVSYALFTGGARSASVDRAQAEARAAAARVEVTREEVALVADRARTAEDEARARVLALEAAVASFEELVRVERLALDEGSGVQSDYLRGVAGLHRARAGLARARRDVLEARVLEARALGSLTLPWIEQRTEERP